MTAALLEAFATKIAGARPGDETHLFAEALSLVANDTRAAQHCQSRAFADAAIRIHRALLPEHGYQFGATAARWGIASIWERGDPHAISFEAATPALALLRACAHAAALRASADRRARCTRCGGLGWTIMEDGDKRICGHGNFL